MHVIVIIDVGWAANHEAELAQLEARSSVEVIRLEVPDAGTWLARLTRGRAVSHAADAHRIDVLFVPRDVVGRLRRPYVMLAHNRYAWERGPSSGAMMDRVVEAMRRRYARRSAHRAIAVLAVSQAFADSLTETPIAGVVHHGCALGERTLSPRRDHEPAVVGMMCNLTEQKGIETVVDAVARVRARIPVALRVYGAPARRRYARQIATMGRVLLGTDIVMGPVPSPLLSDTYGGIDILVIGGSFETFCLPLVEGMRSGCVVVAPQSALVSELCGDVAVTYEEGSAASLAAAISSVIPVDQERRRRGQDRARPFVWSSAVERTLGLVQHAYVTQTEGCRL